MTVTITLDWLAFTYKEITNVAKEWLDTYASFAPIVPETARNGYGEACRDKNGMVQMWNIQRPEMGHHIIITGTCLRNIVECFGISQERLLQSAVNSGASITRLDLAKDAKNVDIDYSIIFEQLNRGMNTGHSKTFSRLQSANGGYTIYVGSRASDRFIRLYNKAAQLDLSGVLWHRLEFETKGMVARAIATLLVNSSMWSGAFNTCVLASLCLPRGSGFEIFFDDTDVQIGIPKIEKKSDTEKWIEEQVTPAVAKWFVEHRDSEAVKRLIDSLNFINTMDE